MKKIILGLCLVYAQFLSAEPLILATDMSYPPFQFMENGELKGAEAEILAEISNRTELQFKLEKISFSGIFPAIENEHADIAMSAIDITKERLAKFDFSEAYYTTTNVFVALEENKKFTSKDDLNGTRIGVISPDSTQERIARKISNTEVVICKNLMNGLSLLNSGRIDVLIVESVAVPIVVYNKFEYLSDVEKNGFAMLQSFGALKKVEIFYVDLEESVGQGLMVKKGTKQKELEKINKAIADMKEDGTIDEILHKYRLR